MTADEQKPPSAARLDEFSFIKLSSKTIFRFHALQRMFERKISEAEVSEVLSKGKIIENYPTDQPYPSCLKLGFVRSRPLHVVLATNSDDQSQIIITVYEPDSGTWDPSFERRKK
jgi:hypothetical protein